LAIAVTLGRRIEFKMLALALELVAPVGVIANPETVVEVAVELVLEKVQLDSLAASALNEESAIEVALPEVAVEVTVKPVKVPTEVILP